MKPSSEQRIHQTELTEIGVPTEQRLCRTEQARAIGRCARRHFSTGVLVYEMLTGSLAVSRQVHHRCASCSIYISQSRWPLPARPRPRTCNRFWTRRYRKDPRDRYQKNRRAARRVRKVLHEVAGGAKLKKPRAAPSGGIQSGRTRDALATR